jgi:hypothetical protein
MNENSAAPTSPRRWGREFLLFGLCSLAGMSFVFGPAMLNRAIIAPLDLPSALYSKYQWLDTTQGPVPQNHYVVDIFDHELPRQYSIYRALRTGEFPWWDPYTEFGRPLVAEAHISGTDPVRLLLYEGLPFVPAYNLTKLLHSFLLGLGTFLLLRHCRQRVGLSIAGALCVQFAGGHTLFQTPLCVSACATWYPWLWLAWSHFVRKPSRAWLAAAGGLCALSIAAGNQQTHAFLALFGVCFVAGHWLAKSGGVKPATSAVIGSGVLGALLALPVLAPQIELYLLCQREPAFADFHKIQLLTGPAGVAAFFPWALGTFQTIDLSKLFGQGGLGFCLFIGCAGLVLAAVGATRLWQRANRTAENCTAVLLLAAYLVICSTPLVAIFYTRVAILVTVGLGLLAVTGAEVFLNNAASIGQRRLVLVLTGGIAIVFLGCNLFAFAVYPRLEKKVAAAFLQRQEQNHSFDAAPALRQAQVKNLPREISVRNPETILGVLSAAALLPAMLARRGRPAWLCLALGLNLLPELSFAQRFTARSPADRWQKLLAGGPEQQRIETALNHGQRLHEQAPGRFDLLYPGAEPMLYRVHADRGYSSFPLPDLTQPLEKLFPGQPACDAAYISTGRGQPTGKFSFTTGGPDAPPARFRWQNPSDRKVEIARESLNTVVVNVGAGPANVLWRTDRYYPGWRLVSPGLPARLTDGFLAVAIPDGSQQLIFNYRPRFLTPAWLASAGAAIFCLFAFIFPGRRFKTSRENKLSALAE